MLKIKKFVFNPFSQNTFVVSDESSNAVIVDPGCYHSFEERELVNFIETNKLTVNAILHTHSHLDHMFGTDFISNKYNVDVYLHENDKVTYDSFEKVCSMYGIAVKSKHNLNIKYFNPSKGYYIGRHLLEIRFVPGHAPGHVVFYNAENEFVINGDCLFQGSIGRTDLPGGNHEQLIKAIRSELFTLPENTKVYCGHGPETNICDEIKSNPFLNS